MINTMRRIRPRRIIWLMHWIWLLILRRRNIVGRSQRQIMESNSKFDRWNNSKPNKSISLIKLITVKSTLNQIIPLRMILIIHRKICLWRNRKNWLKWYGSKLIRIIVVSFLIVPLILRKVSSNRVKWMRHSPRGSLLIILKSTVLAFKIQRSMIGTPASDSSRSPSTLRLRKILNPT